MLKLCQQCSIIGIMIVPTPSGAPLIIHPGRDDRSPFEIISILESAGANIDRTVMSHLDRTLQDQTKLLEFAKLGTLMEYDLFGTECSHYQVRDVPIASSPDSLNMTREPKLYFQYW